MSQKESFFTSATAFVQLSNNEEQLYTGIEQIIARSVFENLFSDKSLIDKNKELILTLQHFISEKNFKVLNGFLADSAIDDLHPSLLKSILLITDNSPEISSYRARVNDILNKRMRG